MADITVRLPDEVKDLIEAQVGDDGFATTGDYIAELARRDNERRLDELRRVVADGLASGVSIRTFEERITEGNRIARERGLPRG